MLTRFEQAQGDERCQLANHIFAMLYADEVTDTLLHFQSDVPADTLMAHVFFWAGEQRINRTDFVAATEYLNRAASYYTESNHASLGDCLNDLAVCYGRRGLYSQAFDVTTRLIALDEAAGDPEALLISYNILGTLYIWARRPEDAEKYIRRSLEIATQLGDSLKMSARYGSLSEVLLSIDKPGEALDHVNEAFRLDSLRGDRSRMTIRRVQKASILESLGQLEEARRLLDRAQPVLDSTNNSVSLTICLNQQGNIALKQRRYVDAERSFTRALEIYHLTGDQNNEIKSHYGLWQTLRHSDITRAATHLETYALLRDTLYRTEMAEVMADYNARYELNELSMQNRQQRERYRFQLILGMLALLLFVAIITALLMVLRMKSRTAAMQQQLQQARDRFFTNITHELRTPLTVIRSATEEILQERNVEHNAHTIQRHGQALLDLINQMLDIARMSSAPSLLQKQWQQIDVVAFVAMVRESYEVYAESFGVKLVYSSSQPRLMMDTVEDYLTKILRNLISNAVKFSPRGSVVTIATRVESGCLILSVADQGPGISPEHLSHIFEPFYQASTGTSISGTGIGLPLVRLCVEALHGSITVQATSGSTFTIVLPITTAAPLGVYIPSPLSVEPPPTLPSVTDLLVAAEDGEEEDDETIHLLIVEDAAEVAYYVSRIVPSDYRVAYATDGVSALAKARQQIPDLIITDIMMPGMDGLELCRQVRQDPLLCHIPVVMVTARTTTEDRIEGLQAGADAYLQKPFRAEELSSCIHNILEQRRRWQGLYAAASAIDPSTQEAVSDASAAGETVDIKSIAPDPFMKLIDAQLEQQMEACHVDMEELAKALCITRTQLNRKVKAIQGVTMRDYAIRVRIDRACHLLAHGEMRIAEIARACGFEDESYFSRFFRKQVGLSPTEYVAHLE